jgi:hypothetical protein
MLVSTIQNHGSNAQTAMILTRNLLRRHDGIADSCVCLSHNEDLQVSFTAALENVSRTGDRPDLVLTRARPWLTIKGRYP